MASVDNHDCTLLYLTLCLSLIEPLPRIAIFVNVSSCSLFRELPLGPNSFPTKLNWNETQQPWQQVNKFQKCFLYEFIFLGCLLSSWKADHAIGMHCRVIYYFIQETIMEFPWREWEKPRISRSCCLAVEIRTRKLSTAKQMYWCRIVWTAGHHVSWFLHTNIWIVASLLT
jgi:hypothetical protein